MTDLPYYLGCPSWSENAWREGLYPQNARPADFLSLYAQVFNAVEGNTTFYARPAPTTVVRWAQSLPEHFRLTAKFPRDISHGGDLREQLHAAEDFLQLLQPLGARVAPFWLQLPASFGPQRLAELVSFVDALQRPLAVEVRHPEFFAKGDAERLLNRLLMDRGVERICLDSRALFSCDSGDPAVLHAQSKKPGCHHVRRLSRNVRRCVLLAVRSLRATILTWCPGLKKSRAGSRKGARPMFFCTRRTITVLRNWHGVFIFN